MENRVPPYRRKRCGLGHSWCRCDTQKACQQSFHGEIKRAEHLTTSSWRRFGPTLALLLQWEPRVLFALGDWTDEVGQNTAHRYTASKCTLSLRAKHTVLSCANSLEHYKFWEEIPPEVLREITDVAADHVAKALRLDCLRVWEGVTLLGSARMKPVAMPDSVTAE